MTPTSSGAELDVFTVVGARPQFIKAAAISRAIDDHNRISAPPIRHQIVHTGQHYDHSMSASFFEELSLPPPRVNLAVGSGTHGAQTGRMLERLESVFVRDAPDVILVLGDTNSTLAAALAGAKLSIPVAHVEAGLRCGQPDMPEEINRVVTDRVSSMLFCPSPTAAANLCREGIVTGVRVVGDVMFDMVRRLADDIGASAEHDREDSDRGHYALATVHRADNVRPARLHAIFDAFAVLAESGLPVTVPLHPRTRRALGARTLPRNVTVTEPVGYGELIRLAARARVVLTDSGGLQREAYWLGVPGVVLRDETEWPETVHDGWNVLAGCDPATIVAAARRPRPTAVRRQDYGRGHAADAVVRELLLFTR